jgi:hypothetical protein
MMLVRGTKKFLDRVGPPQPGEHAADGVLGDWYANALFWRPQAALFVNEQSLVPVLLPLAPAATVLDRVPAAFARVAVAIGVDRPALDAELATMQTHTLAKTASRQILGVMNDFARLAEHDRRQHDDVDLVDVSLWLASVPCSPLYKSHVSPDRALQALLGQPTTPV